MRRYVLLTLTALAAACAGQDSAEPCVRRLDILDSNNMRVGTQDTLRASVSAASGTCNGKEAVSWQSVNTNTVEILSATDSSVIIRGKNTGTGTVVAFLTRITSVRDTVVFTVSVPTDN